MELNITLEEKMNFKTLGEKIKEKKEEQWLNKTSAIERILERSNRQEFLRKIINIMDLAYVYLMADGIYLTRTKNFYYFLMNEVEYEDIDNQICHKFNMTDIIEWGLSEEEINRIKSKLLFTFDKDILIYLSRKNIIYHWGLTQKGIKAYTKIKIMEKKYKQETNYGEEKLELKTMQILAKYLDCKDKKYKNFDLHYINELYYGEY